MNRPFGPQLRSEDKRWTTPARTRVAKTMNRDFDAALETRLLDTTKRGAAIYEKAEQTVAEREANKAGQGEDIFADAAE